MSYTVAYLGFYFSGGGESKIFWGKSGRICMAMGGGFGSMPPEFFFKWCVLENILLKFCQNKNLKIFIFHIKIIHNVCNV